MNLNIRQARPSDFTALTELYNYLHTGDNLPGEVTRRLIAEFAGREDYFLLVAEEDGEIWGTLSLVLIRNLSHCCQPWGLLDNLVVKPTARRRGVARQLVAYAEEVARACGCYKIALMSNFRRREAHSCYQALGFAPHGFSFQKLLFH